MKTILHFIIKEFKQFKRDPKMFALILIAPIFQLTFLGYAANLDVELVKICVYDNDLSERSRNFVSELESSGYFQVYEYANNYDKLTELLEKGKVVTGIVIPKDFEKILGRGETASLQAIFDGSDGNKANISGGYLVSFLNLYSSKILIEAKNRSGSNISLFNSIKAESRVWYNQEMKTRVFMVPGIVGLLLMIITLILTSLAVVKEKEIGTMEQLIVTPIRSYQMIVGKLVPFSLLGLVSVVVVITAMRVIFDIEVRGSIVFLFVSSFAFILSTLGLGLFISTVSKTQQQAMMSAMFVVMMPMMFLSGFAFPIENMPKALQIITHIIPLTYFLTIIRGVVLKGIGIGELWQDLAILFFIGILILSLSVLRFRKRID
ncbi:MAG: ABC transporter permease [Melioribacteraceae bacterium]|nr:ABC transporter permease [Melioribacteraceae bacterium]